MADLREAIESALDYRIKAEKQITQLKADLAKYGGHTAECAGFIPLSEGHFDPEKCDCGWAEVEKGL